jgi:hypothetical protein
MEIAKYTECLVCGSDLNGVNICGVCGFEHREWLVEPSDKLRQYEDQRLELARNLWNRRQEENAASAMCKPLGFLVTEKMVVYCLYEGENTFGSAKVAEIAQHQKLIIPGCALKPVHFSVDVSKGERLPEFTLKEMNPGEQPSVYLNCEDEPVADSIRLADGDSLLVGSGDTFGKVTLRINLNAK